MKQKSSRSVRSHTCGRPVWPFETGRVKKDLRWHCGSKFETQILLKRHQTTHCKSLKHTEEEIKTEVKRLYQEAGRDSKSGRLLKSSSVGKCPSCKYKYSGKLTNAAAIVKKLELHIYKHHSEEIKTSTQSSSMATPEEAVERTPLDFLTWLQSKKVLGPEKQGSLTALQKIIKDAKVSVAKKESMAVNADSSKKWSTPQLQICGRCDYKTYFKTRFTMHFQTNHSTRGQQSEEPVTPKLDNSVQEGGETCELTPPEEEVSDLRLQDSDQEPESDDDDTPDNGSEYKLKESNAIDLSLQDSDEELESVYTPEDGSGSRLKESDAVESTLRSSNSDQEDGSESNSQEVGGEAVDSPSPSDSLCTLRNCLEEKANLQRVILERDRKIQQLEETIKSLRGKDVPEENAIPADQSRLLTSDLKVPSTPDLTPVTQSDGKEVELIPVEVDSQEENREDRAFSPNIEQESSNTERNAIHTSVIDLYQTFLSEGPNAISEEVLNRAKKDILNLMEPNEPEEPDFNAEVNDEYPYGCPECNRGYKIFEYLKRHYLRCQIAFDLLDLTALLTSEGLFPEGLFGLDAHGEFLNMTHEMLTETAMIIMTLLGLKTTEKDHQELTTQGIKITVPRNVACQFDTLEITGVGKCKITSVGWGQKDLLELSLIFLTEYLSLRVSHAVTDFYVAPKMPNQPYLSNWNLTQELTAMSSIPLTTEEISRMWTKISQIPLVARYINEINQRKADMEAEEKLIQEENKKQDKVVLCEEVRIVSGQKRRCPREFSYSSAYKAHLKKDHNRIIPAAPRGKNQKQCPWEASLKWIPGKRISLIAPRKTTKKTKKRGVQECGEENPQDHESNIYHDKCRKQAPENRIMKRRRLNL